jgi:oxygen-independent coproporphyrinogen-3 oxidase
MTPRANRGLYVHFPWCVKKCPYCDFNSHPLREPIDQTAYVSQLLADLSEDLAWAGVEPLTSVFLGGGTPSLFSAAAINELLRGIAARVPLAADVEITLEANPGAVDSEHFVGYRAAGVNRLSIGAQTFDAALLEALGRIHSPDQIICALQDARAAGFERINLDLMHGLPGQDAQAAANDLDIAIATGISHISWYQLTIEPRTEFARRPPTLPAEDDLEAIEREGLKRLEAAGFSRYEVSAFARGDNRCQHNLNYWRFGDYLGIGAGAHGKLTFPATGAIARTQKPKAPARYLTTSPDQLRVCTAVDPDARALEFMMNVLRLVDGSAECLFEATTGLPLAAIEPTLSRLRERGLIQIDRLAPTRLGLRYLDSLVAEFS